MGMDQRGQSVNPGGLEGAEHEDGRKLGHSVEGHKSVAWVLILAGDREQGECEEPGDGPRIDGTRIDKARGHHEHHDRDAKQRSHDAHECTL